MTETQQEGPPKGQEAYPDDASDDASLFRYVGDQGDGTVSQLCSRCQSMLDGGDKKKQIFPHHYTANQLEEAARAGCALCYQYLNCKQETEWGFTLGVQVEEQIHSRPGLSDDKRSSTLWLRVRANHAQRLGFRRPGNPQATSFCVHMFPAKYPGEFNLYSGAGLAHECVHQAPLNHWDHGTKSSTRESLDLAERWLDRCQKSHLKCNNSIGQFLPTRLVRIEENCSHLFLTQSVSGPCQYATLSHCWGKTRFAMLSATNIEQFQTQIPEETLSQTIKDAMRAARHLGFSYLWIDTLCIIQDNPDDWAHESSKMSAVYGNSHLNIAASGAADGSVGCFFERSPHWRCQAEINDQGILRRYDFVASPFGLENLSRMPLMQRAWAFQERMLSARTLHFTETEVFWECFHKQACESFPEEMPWQCGLTKNFFAKQPVKHNLWSWIVGMYSGCDLIFPQDKLVAISGLARHIQQQTRDQYVAGMWRDNLEIQLCWMRDVLWSADEAHDKQSDHYIAPSWSWASLQSRISFYDADLLLQSERHVSIWITIIGIDLQPSTDDPLGALASARLRLSCTMLLCVHIIGHLQFGPCQLDHEGEKVPCTVHYDSQEHTGNGEHCNAYILPIYTTSRSRGGEYMCGLILDRNGEEKGVYRRVGLFCATYPAVSSGGPTRLVAAAQSLKSEDSYEVQIDKSGSPRHVIHLI